MSHSDFMQWSLEVQNQEDVFEIAVQGNAILIPHSRLNDIGGQLRLASSPTVHIGAHTECACLYSFS